MKFSVVLNLTAFALLSMTSGLSLAFENKPEVTMDGLHLTSETSDSLVYLLPDIDLAQYNRVFLDDTYIAFKKNWQDEQPVSGPDKIRAGDMAKIKS